jgi:hypothetical protein
MGCVMNGTRESGPDADGRPGCHDVATDVPADAVDVFSAWIRMLL